MGPTLQHLFDSAAFSRIRISALRVVYLRAEEKNKPGGVIDVAYAPRLKSGDEQIGFSRPESSMPPLRLGQVTGLALLSTGHREALGNTSLAGLLPTLPAGGGSGQC